MRVMKGIMSNATSINIADTVIGCSVGEDILKYKIEISVCLTNSVFSAIRLIVLIGVISNFCRSECQMLILHIKSIV